MFIFSILQQNVRNNSTRKTVMLYFRSKFNEKFSISFQFQTTGLREQNYVFQNPQLRKLYM